MGLSVHILIMSTMLYPEERERSASEYTPRAAALIQARQLVGGVVVAGDT